MPFENIVNLFSFVSEMIDYTLMYDLIVELLSYFVTEIRAFYFLLFKRQNFIIKIFTKPWNVYYK